ncbi:uncharacterized protein A1O9_04213 [Exophiala aquamarina CBS 119918]|uniref:Chromatin remodeling complex subunit n=1 Tax=Exophiala aquamarina CBS 119918 TaxID=1182545 RepID=A0A072PGY4_9EURO|nr:uncharacterized protein A1O9_04213 [Exophiala aquamarina CBS 119918]KEF59369.1 hypothetical protein A1O9_04213 [Exophiala aquamarina CBS 119918]
MPPFKDEHVLIISPGSQITAAQLGLPETFTPPKFRFPTRMFPSLKPGEWEPLRIRSKTVKVPKATPTEALTNGTEPKAEQPNGEPVLVADVEMQEAPVLTEANEAVVPAPPADPPAQAAVDVSQDAQSEAPPEAQPELPSETAQAQIEEAAPTKEKQETSQEGQDSQQQETTQVVEEDSIETFEDDHWSTEGAVYPIREGRIENWSCFFALLSHIYNMISPPFHMPVLFVSQPCWSSRDKEMITQYVFENWKIPAFCLMDAALTACYAYGVPTALVVDVGHSKTDITAVTEFQLNEIGRGVALADTGGQALTKRLQQELKKNDFDEDMAEQLKRSPICEILPLGAALPTGAANPETVNPAAAASTGALDSGVNARDTEGLRPGQQPRGPGFGTAVGDDAVNDDNDEEDDGVLDVAAIVARDNAAELLAKREREKAERALAKSKSGAEPPRPVRLRNSERERASFTYVEYLPIQESEDPDAVPTARKRKREIEVGVERFMAATPAPGMTDGIIDTIAEAIHHTILSVPEVPQRSSLWDNLIILGNGSRIRGFSSSLLATLNARYILSPSTATIFTSELPSNFTTPVATPGTNTPIPGQGGHLQHHLGGHGVNPLLVAATKNMMQPNPHLQVPAQLGADPSLHQSHRGFSQSPTSIKTVKPPEYFPEWKDPSVSGMEEASFLGAQVAAKVVFIVDQGNSKGFLTRSEYNELGPTGIHDCAM